MTNVDTLKQQAEALLKQAQEIERANALPIIAEKLIEHYLDELQAHLVQTQGKISHQKEKVAAQVKEAFTGISDLIEVVEEVKTYRVTPPCIEYDLRRRALTLAREIGIDVDFEELARLLNANGTFGRIYEVKCREEYLHVQTTAGAHEDVPFVECLLKVKGIDDRLYRLESDGAGHFRVGESLGGEYRTRFVKPTTIVRYFEEEIARRNKAIAVVQRKEDTLKAVEAFAETLKKDGLDIKVVPQEEWSKYTRTASYSVVLILENENYKAKAVYYNPSDVAGEKEFHITMKNKVTAATLGELF
jgi:hypothetical protein